MNPRASRTSGSQIRDGDSGLTAGTEYHFRMFAENGTGTTNGGDRTFKTGAPPTATTDPATGIGPVSATLKGTVNPKGLETEYFFNYGKTEAYGQKTAETTIAGGAVERRRSRNRSLGSNPKPNTTSRSSRKTPRPGAKS